jgi:hypothetical protein
MGVVLVTERARSLASDPRLGVGMGPSGRLADERGTPVDVLGTDRVLGNRQPDLAGDPIAVRHDGQPAVDVAQRPCVLAEHVEHRGSRIVGATEAQDDDGVARSGRHRRQLIPKRLRRGEEDGAVGLQDDDLIGADRARRVDLLDAAVGMEDQALRGIGARRISASTSAERSSVMPIA